MRIKTHRTAQRRNHLAWITSAGRWFWGLRWWYKGLLLGFGMGTLLFLYGWLFLPSVGGASQLQFAESTFIYDRGALEKDANPSEHVLYTIHGEENREYVPLKEISPWIVQATIAIEDDGFYSHFGFDIGGIIKAVAAEFFGIGNRRGGSTITQQLVKNTFLSRERTIRRKFNELVLSMKMEWVYSKDEILELYLNKIPYGYGANGIEAASQRFFGKSARDLTLAEASVLASLPVAPTRFSPHGSNKDMLMGFYEIDEKTGEKVYKKGRKDLVLQRMLDLKMITFEQFKTAWAEANELEFQKNITKIKSPHFVFLVRQQLEEKYGAEFLRQGGLRIYTTIDPEFQEIAETVIDQKSAHYPGTWNARNAALAAIDPENGEILAYVGGKNYFDDEHDGQFDVLTARRQPGSSFKPFVYAAGFAKGYSPATVLFDVETDFGGNYTPQDFDGKFSGPVSVREAINRSLNIPAVKMAYLAGPANIIKLAKKVGIKIEGTAEQHGVALGIGVAEVEPLSLISAFQVFTGDGSYYEPTVILEVQDGDGFVLEQSDPQKRKKEGLKPGVAALVRNVLTDADTRPTTNGFDWNKLLQLENWDNGVKTGTSNRMIENPDFDEEKPEDKEENPKEISAPADSWTIGFTPYLVSGVWVGNNRGEPMKPGATGLAVAAPIWRAFMLQAHAVLVERGADPKKQYKQGEPLEIRKVNKYSGNLVTDFTPPRLVKEEVFAADNVPTEPDDSVKQVEVDKISGRVATSFTPQYSRVLRYVLNLKSILPKKANWQNPVEEWIENHPKFMTSLGAIMDAEPEKDALGRKIWSRYEDGFLARRYQQRLQPDDVHNAFTTKNAPKVQVLSPKGGGVVAPGKVEIKVSVQAKFGLKTVEFYFDDQLVDDSTQYPWTGMFQIPDSVTEGSQHTIRVVAVDRLLGTGEDLIEIEIAPDIQGPEISFLGPVGNQRMPLNSILKILANVWDTGSSVDRVEFSLDGKTLGIDQTSPYESSLVAVGSLGRHSLVAQAWDAHGNVSKKEIPIIFEYERLHRGTSPIIQDVISYRNSISVGLVFPDPKKVKYAELLATRGDEVFYSEKLTQVAKDVQIQIPKSAAGRVRLQLFTKLVGVKQPHKAPEKMVDL